MDIRQTVNPYNSSWQVSSGRVYRISWLSSCLKHKTQVGDYSQAVFVPGIQKIFFASEYIQYPNCNDQAFISGAQGLLTCGGTRTLFTNWGTSISFVNT